MLVSELCFKYLTKTELWAYHSKYVDEFLQYKDLLDANQNPVLKLVSHV